MSFAFAVIL